MPEQDKYSLKVFVRDKGKRIFCGQYETKVDNYVLSVDVFGRPLEVQSVEIEFLGKVLSDIMSEKFHCTVLENGCSSKVFCGRRPAVNWVAQNVFDVIRPENQCIQCRTARIKSKMRCP